MFPYYSPAQQNYVSPYCGNAFVGRSFKIMSLKDFLKLTAFLQALTFVVWGLMFIGAFILNIDGMSVKQLLLVMGVVFGAIILTAIVVPVAERWLS